MVKAIRLVVAVWACFSALQVQSQRSNPRLASEDARLAATVSLVQSRIIAASDLRLQRQAVEAKLAAARARAEQAEAESAARAASSAWDMALSQEPFAMLQQEQQQLRQEINSWRRAARDITQREAKAARIVAAISQADNHQTGQVLIQMSTWTTSEVARAMSTYVAPLAVIVVLVMVFIWRYLADKFSRDTKQNGSALLDQDKEGLRCYGATGDGMKASFARPPPRGVIDDDDDAVEAGNSRR